MAYSASHRFARIAATKVRPFTQLIRGRLAGEALELLKYEPNRGARMLRQQLRAIHDGRKLKDTMSDLLRKGLRAVASKSASKPRRVKLPIVQCRRMAELTPDQIAGVLEQQESQWHHEAAGH